MRLQLPPGALLALVLGGVAAPSDARATGVPSPANSSVPACIRLVGSDGSVAATAFGGFEVVHRDLANNPIPDALIVVDFSAAPELFIAANQFDPSATVDCALKTVSKRTDANGRAVFCIVGASTDEFPPSTQLNGGRIYANGMLIGDPTVSAFDLDGRLGLGATDLTHFLSDFASGNLYGRSDFDCSGGIGARDLAEWLKAFGSGTQVVSAATACP